MSSVFPKILISKLSLENNSGVLVAMNLSSSTHTILFLSSDFLRAKSSSDFQNPREIREKQNLASYFTGGREVCFVSPFLNSFTVSLIRYSTRSSLDLISSISPDTFIIYRPCRL